MLLLRSCFDVLAEAQCSLNGETSTCKERIDWTQASTVLGLDSSERSNIVWALKFVKRYPKDSCSLTF